MRNEKLPNPDSEMGLVVSLCWFLSVSLKACVSCQGTAWNGSRLGLDPRSPILSILDIQGNGFLFPRPSGLLDVWTLALFWSWDLMFSLSPSCLSIRLIDSCPGAPVPFIWSVLINCPLLPSHLALFDSLGGGKWYRVVDKRT